jgi:hypothetical protein
VQDKNPTRFYCKNGTRIEQGCDKRTYPKLVLNKLKVMWDSTYIYTHWAPSLKIPLKKLPTYKWINKYLKANWKLIKS